MRTSRTAACIAAFLGLCLALSFPTAGSPEALDGSLAACLKVWGDHPFGKAPQFKTLGSSVRVFGIGTRTEDTDRSSAPLLVLIEPSVNLLGWSTIELSNPNAWYCMRTAISMMGTLNIRAHCKAQLAMTSGGSTARGNNGENRSLKDITVTVVGSVDVERPCD